MANGNSFVFCLSIFLVLQVVTAFLRVPGLHTFQSLRAKHCAVDQRLRPRFEEETTKLISFRDPSSEQLRSRNGFGRGGTRGQSTNSLRMATSSPQEQTPEFLTFFDNLEIRAAKRSEKGLQRHVEASEPLQTALLDFERSVTLAVVDANVAEKDDQYTSSAWLCFDNTEEAHLIVHSEHSLHGDLSTFLLQAAQTFAKDLGFSRIVMSEPAAQGWESALSELGFSSSAGKPYCKGLASQLREVGSKRSEEKGSSELLEVINMQKRPIAILPRHKVEEHNLLINAIGVLVHNRAGQIYVHQRSPYKSMHASYFDMFVGGLVLAGEAVPDAARNEVKEELGIEGKALQPLFEVVWLGSRNRVVLSVFRVEAEEPEVSYNDGEVVWGKFMSLQELEEMMAAEQFVPGGMKAWDETVSRELHTKYLK